MKKQQNGFTVVEGLLITVIVGIIGATGWYVWHSMSQADKNLSSADSSANSIISKKKTATKQSTTSPVSSSKSTAPAPVSPIPASIVSPAPTYVTTTPTVVNNYITINEWNVKAKFTGKLKIMYAHDSHDKDHKSSFFSSTQLVAKGSSCKADKYPAGYVVRYKFSEHVYDVKGVDTGKTATQYADELAKSADLPSMPFAHLGDYFYFYNGPQSKCAESKEAQDLQDQNCDEIRAIVKSFEIDNN